MRWTMRSTRPRSAANWPLAEGLATYPTEEELLTEALLGAEKTGRDVKLFMNRMEHDDYRNVPELNQAACPECGAPLQNDEVWLKRGNTGYFTRATCPCCGHYYLRFKLSRRDGLHWSFARCIDPATPESDARWDKQKAALLERMKKKAGKVKGPPAPWEKAFLLYALDKTVILVYA